MSEEILSEYVDQHMAHGDKAPPPSDPETQKLVGTVRLAHSALSSPSPPAGAEDQSRAEVLSRIDSIKDSPASAHQAPGSGDPPSGVNKFIRRIKQLFHR